MWSWLPKSFHTTAWPVLLPPVSIWKIHRGTIHCKRHSQLRWQLMLTTLGRQLSINSVIINNLKFLRSCLKVLKWERWRKFSLWFVRKMKMKPIVKQKITSLNLCPMICTISMLSKKWTPHHPCSQLHQAQSNVNLATLVKLSASILIQQQLNAWLRLLLLPPNLCLQKQCNSSSQWMATNLILMMKIIRNYNLLLRVKALIGDLGLYSCWLWCSLFSLEHSCTSRKTHLW